MNFIAAPALVMLAALPILVWLSMARRSPKQRDVGTLFIWRKVTSNVDVSTSKRRWFDVLFWLLIASVVVGAISAARPASSDVPDSKKLAVFIERVFDTGHEPQLEYIAKQVAEISDDAEVTFFVRGILADNALHEIGKIHELKGGSSRAALSAYTALSREYDGHLLFVLHDINSEWHKQPRLQSPLTDLITGVFPNENRIVIRYLGKMPEVKGAAIIERRTGAIVITPDGHNIDLASGKQQISITRKPFGVGVGEGWHTRQHRALFAALQVDANTIPEVWLGAEQNPAVRITQGKATDLIDVEVHIDPAHRLFAELPLYRLDWLAEGKLMQAEHNVVPLVRVTRGGKVLGDIVRKKGDVVEFAGDPFSMWPIELSALLLDNLIETLTGRRPSERKIWGLTQPSTLPSAAALSPIVLEDDSVTIFEPRQASWHEYGHGLAIFAGLMSLVAAAFAAKKRGTPKRAS